MNKRHTRFLAAGGSLLAGAAIALSGFAAAGAAPAGPARDAVSGTEHFQLVTTSATATKGQVIAYGLFGGAAVDHMGNTVDKFVFKGGSFKVWHSNGTGNPAFNAKTCVIYGKIHGTIRIYGGSGKFAGITGHGHYVYTLLGITKRKKNGACVTSQNALPSAVEDIIQATGTVRL